MSPKVFRCIFTGSTVFIHITHYSENSRLIWNQTLEKTVILLWKSEQIFLFFLSFSITRRRGSPRGSWRQTCAPCAATSSSSRSASKASSRTRTASPVHTSKYLLTLPQCTSFTFACLFPTRYTHTVTHTHSHTHTHTLSIQSVVMSER